MACFLWPQKVGQHMKKGGRRKYNPDFIIYGLVAPDMRIYKGAVYLNKNINTPAVYTVSKAAVIGLQSIWSPTGGIKNKG